MPPDDRVFLAAQRVLARVVAGFAAADVELPSRQFIHAGSVAYDCEQVVVEISPALQHGFPGSARAAGECELPRHVSLNVLILRCVPLPSEKGDPPKATDLQASARTFAIDSWHLADSVYVAYKDGGLNVPLEGCTLASIGDVNVLEPSGGIGGVSLSLEVQV